DAWRAMAWATDRLTSYNVRDKIYKLASVMGADNVEEMYLRLVSHWKRPTAIVPGAREPRCAVTDPSSWAGLRSPTSRVMCLDLVSYLPDDILVKLDRASMGVSLEARVPFLDHRVVELAWRIPLSIDLRHTSGKWPLRQVLKRYVPPAITERP